MLQHYWKHNVSRKAQADDGYAAVAAAAAAAADYGGDGDGGDGDNDNGDYTIQLIMMMIRHCLRHDDHDDASDADGQDADADNVKPRCETSWWWYCAVEMVVCVL